MSQQAMHFDAMNRDESASSPADDQNALHYEEIPREKPTSSSAEYEEGPQHHDFFMGSFGQKLSGRDTRQMITLDHRLVLAIVSLVLLMLMSFVGIGLALVTGGGGPTVAGGDVMFVHVFRHRPDFVSGDGMAPPPEAVYSSFPVHVHHWTAASAVLPMFVLVFITFTLAVLAINVIFSRSAQRS